MFAVPGWSLSADNLKAEQESPVSLPTTPSTNSNSKKRKRPLQPQVTASNVVEFYESVIGGGGEIQESKSKKGKVKPKKGPRHGTKDATDISSKEKLADDQASNIKPDGNKSSGSILADDGHLSKLAPSSRPPQAAKLTPMQASMRDKLVSARFRHLNETLYTRPSGEALRLFQESPDMFDEYHEGFRRQVKVWPENPVDCFLDEIRSRAKLKSGRDQKARLSNPCAASVAAIPLPRTAGSCIIADLGCGDARLAQSLQTHQAKLKLQVKSFDLHSPSPLVTRADVANLPLEDDSINVAIFCLALMGTNWLDFIDEAYRILHWKGELWVAEIKSRFGPLRSVGSHTKVKPNAPVEHSVGNRKKAGSNKLKPGSRAHGHGDNSDDEALDVQDLEIEVDGVEDRRRETDVSAFIEALRKRGFVLDRQRKHAVNLSNRMFVIMHFIKADTPTKGKNAKPTVPSSKSHHRFAPKQQDCHDETCGDLAEASILKPCVYKIR